MPSHVSSLCLLLSCLAFVRAAPPPLAHLSNASLWGFLPYDDWWVRLQGEVVHPLAATARLPPPPDLSARLGTDKVALSKLEGNPAFHWVRRELQVRMSRVTTANCRRWRECPAVSLLTRACRLLSPGSPPAVQCQLTFLSLVCGALASVYPELLGHARQRPAGPLDWRQQWSVPEMARDLERRLLLITSALQRNQTVAALELSTHAAMVLGWKWQGVHVTALADPAPAASGSAGNGRPNNSHSSVDGTMSVASQLGLCWDEVAVLNVLSDPDTWPGACRFLRWAARRLQAGSRVRTTSDTGPACQMGKDGGHFPSTPGCADILHPCACTMSAHLPASCTDPLFALLLPLYGPPHQMATRWRPSCTTAL